MNLRGRNVTTMKMTARRMKNSIVIFASSHSTKFLIFSKKSAMISIHYREKLAPLLDSLIFPQKPTLAILYCCFVWSS